MVDKGRQVNKSPRDGGVEVISGRSHGGLGVMANRGAASFSQVQSPDDQADTFEKPKGDLNRVRHANDRRTPNRS